MGDSTLFIKQDPTPAQIEFLTKNWNTMMHYEIARKMLISNTVMYRWAGDLGLRKRDDDLIRIPIRTHKRSPPKIVLPVLARPGWFVNEDLQSQLVGKGRHDPLRPPVSAPSA